MEFVLDLVNHVPREMADRLIEYFRSEESARCDAEDLCLEAEERKAAVWDARNERTSRASRGVGCASPALLGVAFLVLLSLLVWLLGGFAFLTEGDQWRSGGHFVRELEPVAAGDEGRSHVRLAAAAPLEADQGGSGSESIQDGKPESSDFCGSLLQDAKEDVRELDGQLHVLQDGYRDVLEAWSEWVDFVRVAMGMSIGGTINSTSSGASSGSFSTLLSTALPPRELEARCLAAFQPGRRAIENLLVSGAGGSNGREGVSTAARLADRLSRLRRQSLRPRPSSLEARGISRSRAQDEPQVAAPAIGLASASAAAVL